MTTQILATCIASYLLASLTSSTTTDAFVLPHHSPLTGNRWGSSPARRTPSVRRIFLSASSSSSSSEDSSLFDMKELQQRINQEYSAAASLPLGLGVGAGAGAGTQRSQHSHYPQEQSPQQLPSSKPDKVHVVIFQSGTMNQGAHTIEYPQGSGNNVVLAFESYHACLHFAESLADQHHFVDPEPLEFDTDKLEAYFDRLGVAVQVIPRGMEVKPPTKNVPQFGHNPTLRDTKKHLEYLFDMMTTTDDDDDDWEDLGFLDTATTSYDGGDSWQ